MKKVPLKWKLTILYAAFMILMTGIMLSILFSLSSSEILSSVETDLENDVFGAFEDIQWDGKRLKIDRDFYEVEKGIYLSAYNSGESLIGGRIPYEFTLNVPLGEGLRRLTQEGDQLVYMGYLIQYRRLRQGVCTGDHFHYGGRKQS